MKIETSVIIPFYENFTLLKRALNSVFNQSYKNYEIILIYDNHKKDDLSKLKQFVKKKSNVKIILNKNNIGAGLSRNKGIKLASGKYICFLDSDDTWKKQKLYLLSNFMKKRGISISHTSYDIVSLKSNIISKRIAKDLQYNDLLNSCDVGLSTIMIEKKLLKSGAKFPGLKTKEDFVLWLKISKKGHTFYGIKKSLTRWTDHPNSLSKSTFQKIIDAYRVYNKYEGYNLFNSLIRVLILSVNFLKKR